MASVTSYVEVDIHEFSDDQVLRQALRILTDRAESGPLDHASESVIERIARMLGIEPGSLPPASTAATTGAYS